jgi:NAD(P)H-binding
MNMKLVILFSKGGLGDVGRHAVRAALDRPNEIEHITVISQYTDSLKDKNWNSACSPSEIEITEDEWKRLTIVPIQSWEDEASFLSYFEGAGAVISCMGNRQMTLGDRVSGVGNTKVVKAMTQYNIPRVVSISSVGIRDDWPPLEFHWSGKVLSCIFLTVGRSDYKDLSKGEEAYADSPSAIDYLIVRPVGLGEDIAPVGKWWVQKEKYKDTSFHFDSAKLDCARFMIEEVLKPTRHRTAVVLGAPLPGS